MDWNEFENCPVVRKLEVLFANHGYYVLRVKKEWACYQHTAEKLVYLIVWGCKGNCMSVKEGLMLNSIYRFWSNIWCQPDDIFFR